MDHLASRGMGKRKCCVYHRMILCALAIRFRVRYYAETPGSVQTVCIRNCRASNNDKIGGFTYRTPLEREAQMYQTASRKVQTSFSTSIVDQALRRLYVR